MGGKLMMGRRVSEAEGKRVAEVVVLGLGEENLERWEVCGSLRRKKAEVGDVDLVILPAEGREEVVMERLRGLFGSQKNGKPARTGKVEGVQVDVGVADRESWGAQVLFLTGSKEWNVMMRARAKRMGFLLNEKGCFERGTGRRVAGRTEEEIFEKLGLEFRKPEEREFSGWISG